LSVGQIQASGQGRAGMAGELKPLCIESHR
jgi:hypothetical protein